MLNILIAESNMKYSISLMNYISNKISGIKICNIALNIQETMEILENNKNIDMILMEKEMYVLNELLLKCEMTKRKINTSLCVINYSYKSEIEQEINKIKKKKEKNIKKVVKEKILNELIYLGYDVSHKGTIYLFKSIEYIIANCKELDKLEKNIYPEIAKLYNTSSYNLKCRIHSATTSMYYNCEMEKMKKYFHFDNDIKPKVKTIIATIINKVMLKNNFL